MALGKPRTIYGIHLATFYEIATGLPYGTIRVLGGSTISLAGELISLTGGSSPYPWDAQDGAITPEISLKLKEIPNFLFKLFLGKTPTEALDSAANVSALVNIFGTSIFDAAAGIASVGVKSGSEDDVKFSKYIVRGVSPTTVDVYAYSNIDFFRGTDKQYENDLLKITAAPLTVPDGAPVEVPGFGVELTGGTSVAMTADDTASFEANPASLEQMDVLIGEQGVCIPEFGVVVNPQKQANGSMWEIDCFRVKALGMPLGMEEKAFNEMEITGTLLYDSTENGVYKSRYLKPTTACS